MNFLNARGKVHEIRRPPVDPDFSKVFPDRHGAMPKAALLGRCCRKAAALFVLLATLQLSGAARGSILPLGEPEQQAWSDMAFASGVTGGFNAGTKLLSITASPSNSL